MTTTATTQPQKVTCPPGCKHTGDRIHHHQVEVDDDGNLIVQHEVDFGEYLIGMTEQYLDGSPVLSYVNVSDLDEKELHDPTTLRLLAADVLAAAEWLDLVGATS